MVFVLIERILMQVMQSKQNTKDHMSNDNYYYCIYIYLYM